MGGAGKFSDVYGPCGYVYDGGEGSCSCGCVILNSRLGDLWRCKEFRVAFWKGKRMVYLGFCRRCLRFWKGESDGREVCGA